MARTAARYDLASTSQKTQYGWTSRTSCSIDQDLNTSNPIVYQKTKITDVWLLQQGTYKLELAKLVELSIVVAWGLSIDLPLQLRSI
jgi:hypothetical protein